MRGLWRWLVAAMTLLVAIAIWSRISQLNEGPALIRNGLDSLSKLFKGVLK